jgi:PIN domain nuclease of toxin-antitoxin system
LLLVERGRLQLREGITPAAWIDEALSLVPIRDAPTNREVAVLSRTIGLPHQDPADRFIAATAAVYDLTLVSGDERLLAGSGYQTLANR